MSSLIMDDIKKVKFTPSGLSLADHDVCRVWDSVAAFIARHLSNQKGVYIPHFGTFSFVQTKMDVGGNKYVLIQRPVFQISEKFCQTHDLKQTKAPIAGCVPVVQLNYAALTLDTPFDRDQIEACVREVIGSLNRWVAAQRNTEFTFSRVGRLQIRDRTVKFKFYKDFVTSLDNSGRVLTMLQNRPGTADSVMTDRPDSRPFSVSLPVPPNFGKEAKSTMPTIPEDGVAPEILINEIEPELQRLVEEDNKPEEQPAKSSGNANGRASSVHRAVVPVALATTELNLGELGLVSDRSSNSRAAPASLRMASGSAGSGTAALTIPRPKTAGDATSGADLFAIKQLEQQLLSDGPMPEPVCEPMPAAPRTPQSATSEARTASEQNHTPTLTPPKPPAALLTPIPSRSASSACGHPASAGQELCYLCHQRQKRNIPVYMAEENRLREEEDDRLLYAYQTMKDTEHLMRERDNLLTKRHDSQKVAAFNLGVSEAVHEKRVYRDPNFYRSFIFQSRPLTPPRQIKQNLLSNDLSRQVEENQSTQKRLQADEQYLERLEQVQLAEDLAAQREQYLRRKATNVEDYKRALSAQLRHKPEPLPATQELDSPTAPYFGKNDVTAEKLLEKRRRAQDVWRDQLDLCAQKRQEAAAQRMQEQMHDEDVLKRTKENLMDDRSRRYQRHLENRRTLESEWMQAAREKRERDMIDRLRAASPGDLLVHEQCDQYKRCGQCRRRLTNHGETNVWKETYYIPGSRYIC